MKYKITIIFLLIFTIFAATFGLNKNQTLKHKINAIFPHKIGSCEGNDVKVDNSVYKILDPQELLMRNYKNRADGKSVSLSIVLTNKRDHIHSPEICYRGQGIDMDNEKLIKYKDIDAIFVNGKKNTNTFKVMYWYTDIKKTYSNRTEFMKHIIFSDLLGKPVPEFALVIVSGYNLNDRDLLLFSEQINNILSSKLGA